MSPAGPAAAAAALAIAAGCADPASNEPPVEKPSYVVAASVFDAESTRTYLSYQKTLELDEIDLDTAVELTGGATLAGVDGMIFVGDGESPTITRFELDERGNPVETGRLSFLNEGAPSTLYTNFFGSAERAYMDVDNLERVVWDPSAMVIRGRLPFTQIAGVRDGKMVTAGYDRSAGVRAGRAFQPFYWTDADYYAFLGTSQIAVIDTASDTVRAVIEAPCPGLDVATTDAAGNLYFSNWVFSVYAPLVDPAAPKNCAVKIPAGAETIDAGWTRSLSEMTQGREAAGLRHIGGGTAVMAVLHDELIPPGTDPADVAALSIWRLWRVELAAWTAAPIEGLEPFSGGYYSFPVDGKTVLLLPTNDYSATTAYEIGTTGPAIRRFKTQGWAYQMLDLGAL